MAFMNTLNLPLRQLNYLALRVVPQTLRRLHSDMNDTYIVGSNGRLKRLGASVWNDRSQQHRSSQ